MPKLTRLPGPSHWAVSHMTFSEYTLWLASGPQWAVLTSKQVMLRDIGLTCKQEMMV